MRREVRARSGFAWLEMLLALAVLVLLFELIPSLWLGILWGMGFRNLPRTFWFGGNLFVVFVLLLIRFGPELYHEGQERRGRPTAERERKQKRRQLKEQREMLAKMQQARSRWIY